jgi:hypothetical protein
MTSKQKSSSRPGRKRGAQPGNNNALKHGFYSRSYQQREKELLAQLSPTALQGEIDLNRVSNRHILETIQDHPEITLEQLLSAYRVISLNNVTIASLTRTQFQAARASLEASETADWLETLLTSSESEQPQ